MSRHAPIIPFALGLSLILTAACRPAAQPDEAPTTQRLSQATAKLLPDASRLTFGVRPAALEEVMRSAFGVSDEAIVDYWLKVPAVLGDLLGPEAVEGVDREGRHFIAVSTAGHRDVIDHLRAGAPLRTLENLPSELHLRVIVETRTADQVARNLLTRCAERSDGGACSEFMRLTPHTGALTVDLLLRESMIVDAADLQARRIEEELKAMGSPNITPTAAWHAFEDPTAPVAIYGTMGDLFDLAALYDAMRFARVLGYAEVDDAQGLADRASLEISQSLQFDSPDVAEVHDMMVRLVDDGARVFIDGVGSLTPYGASLERLGRVDAPLAISPSIAGILDARWAFDVNAATAAATLPFWAQAPQGVASEQFNQRLQERYGQVGQWANLMYLQYPVTMLRVGFEHSEIFGNLPPEARILRGLQLRAGPRPGQEDSALSLENLVGAFAMVSSGEYSLDGNLETLRPMLGAFGVESDSRSTAFDDRREYGMSIGALVSEVFEEQEQTLEAGTRVFVDLEALNALSASAAPASEGEMIDREGFVGRYPHLYYASRTVEDQWLLRLQFGGDAHLGLAPVTGTAPVPVAPGSQCAHEATRKALDDLELVASVTPAERAKIAGVVTEELEAIAATCPDDALAQERIAFLVDAWSVRARSARE